MKKLKDKLISIKSKAIDELNNFDQEKLQDKLNKGKSLYFDYQRIASEKLSDPTLQQQLKDSVSKGASKFSDAAIKGSGVIGIFLADNSLLKHLETLTKSASTAYDKALDSEYLKTHIGGGDHRLFDGGHDVFNAWDRVKDALPDDSFDQEVLGYISSLWKDLSTSKGLPFTTVSKDSFESWVNTTSEWIPGMDRKYLYDLLSFDAYELLSTGLGAVGVLFALKKADQEKLAELLGSMGIVSILSANPIMGLFVIGTSAFAYSKKKMEFDKKSFAKSTIVTSTSMALFSILGMPILFELVIIGVLTKVLRKQVLDNDDFLDSIKEKVTNNEYFQKQYDKFSA